MEKFDIVKMFSGLFKPVHWAKTIMFSLSAGCIIFIGFGVYKGYFKKPEPVTEQKAEIIKNHYHQPKMMGFGCAFSKGIKSKTKKTMVAQTNRL